MNDRELKIRKNILSPITDALAGAINTAEKEITEIENILRSNLTLEEKLNFSHLKNTICTEVTLMKSSLDIFGCEILAAKIFLKEAL